MNKLYSEINPNILFICTILCLPTVFFQDSLVLLAIQTILFFALVFIKKQKVRSLPSVIVLFSVIFFSLLTPNGKIIWQTGSFTLTEGAFFYGLEKALKLLLMMYISQYAISRNLKLQGSLGMLTSNIFYYFDALSENKSRFSIKKPIQSIDGILLDVYNAKSPETKDTTQEYSTIIVEKNKQSFISWLICILPFLLSYILLFI